MNFFSPATKLIMICDWLAMMDCGTIELRINKQVTVSQLQNDNSVLFSIVIIPSYSTTMKLVYFSSWTVTLAHGQLL